MSSSQHLCEESKAHFPLSEKQKVMVTKPVPAKAEIWLRTFPILIFLMGSLEMWRGHHDVPVRLSQAGFPKPFQP